MKEIELANTSRKALVDDEDFDRVSFYKWYVTWHNGRPVMVHFKSLVLSRFILRYDGPLEIDHKDRNIFNNQKSNLREATKQQQSANHGKQEGFHHSKYKGVTWHKQRKHWLAYINKRLPGQKRPKMITLGFHPTQEAAALAYNKKAIELFGEFACLNEIKK